jgi:hypothetical protein
MWSWEEYKYKLNAQRKIVVSKRKGNDVTNKFMIYTSYSVLKSNRLQRAVDLPKRQKT